MINQNNLNECERMYNSHCKFKMLKKRKYDFKLVKYNSLKYFMVDHG